MTVADFEKSAKSELTGISTHSSGKIYIVKDRFRLDQLAPDKTKLVFDGTYLWNEQQPSEDFPGPVQVTKTKISKKDPVHILFGSLVDRDLFQKSFEVEHKSSSDNQIAYSLKPNKDLNTMKNVVLTLDKNSKLISQISFVDDVENLTVLSLKKTEFKNINKEIFLYKVPKGAQLTDLNKTSRN